MNRGNAGEISRNVGQRSQFICHCQWMWTTAYRRRRNSSLPTIARFEIGEELLTASMSEVFLRLGDSVLSGNSTLRKRHAKSVVIQIGHSSSLSERQPAGAVKAASQFNLHVPLAFARPEGQVCKGLLVQFKNHAHKDCLSFAILTGIPIIATQGYARKLESPPLKAAIFAIIATATK